MRCPGGGLLVACIRPSVDQFAQPRSVFGGDLEDAFPDPVDRKLLQPCGFFVRERDIHDAELVDHLPAQGCVALTEVGVELILQPDLVISVK